MGYLHIANLYRQQEILLFKEAYAMEKIDGSSAHIIWKDSKLSFFSGCANHNNFISLFNQEDLTQKFINNFADINIILYGEVYGSKIQGMSNTYGKNLKFIVFDIKIGDNWLSIPQAEELAKSFNLEFVHYVKISTDLESINGQRDADSVQAIRNGMGEGHIREGIVLRPLIEVTKNNGERIICKHKREEFSERQNTPKVVNPEQLIILQNAKAIADEWVVSNRLEHVLQKLPEAIGMEHTSLVIKAMIEDVLREANGEIIESKEVSSAIGKKAAQLWKNRVTTICT